MKIRNIALAGHGSSGKTSLGDALLFRAGVTNRLGKVDDGTSFLDFDEDEVNKRASINVKVATFDRGDVRINLIDTPGYIDFAGDMYSGLSVADCIVIVVDASSGMEFVTEKVVEYAGERSLPRAFFISKINKENVDFEKVYNELKSDIGDGLLPITIPLGKAPNVKGVIDILQMKAFTPDGEMDIPDDMKQNVQEFRDKLVEAIAESDETLMEKFINEEEITGEEIQNALSKGFKEGNVFPVFAGDSLSLIGIDPVLYYFETLFPSPSEVKLPDDLKSVDGPVVAYVFKTVFEPHVGVMNLVRVFRGTLKSGETLLNTTTGKEEKINQVFLLKGKDRTDTKELEPGSIGALVKLKETKTTHTLASPSDPVKLEDLIKFPEPLISVAIVPKSKGDEDKVSNGLARLHDEDPTFHHTFDVETKQTLISGLGEQHLDVIINRLKRKFGVEVDTEKPRIHYRETIKAKAEAQGKYKKQTGGRGQYGDVYLRIEPLERGKGFEFVDEIVGGVIPSKYIPSVEKGVKEAMEQGFLAGYPVIDLKATVYYGSFHPVDSSDIAFKIAASMAFKNAMEKAKPVLLEPILEVEVFVPEEYMGDVIGDLNSRRGKILGMDRVGKYQRVRAYVPEAEMYKYSNTLRSITQGKGTFTQKFAFYEEVPHDIAEKIIAERKREMEENK